MSASLTLNYDALLSTTLFNYRKTMEDQISTANVLFYMMKNDGDGYDSVDDIGDRLQVPLMYELGSADSYSGYDVLGTQPMDGITAAFFDWRQFSAPISISGLEEKKNQGEARIINLLESKTKQAVLGIQEKFSKTLFQGNGVNSPAVAGQTETAYVSPSNSSSFIDPLPLFVKKDPTTGTVGSLDASTHTWWRNQQTNSSSATYAAFKKELRNLYNNCGKGPGKFPNLHITDQLTSEYYEEVLSASHRNPSYQKADIPFDSVGFRGKPVVWDEFMPNWEDRVVATSSTKGSWLMLNTKFWGVRYHKGTNFNPGPFEKPINQDAKVSIILWLGAAYVSNRRKQGVMWGIDTTVTS